MEETDPSWRLKVESRFLTDTDRQARRGAALDPFGRAEPIVDVDVVYCLRSFQQVEASVVARLADCQ